MSRVVLLTGSNAPQSEDVLRRTATRLAECIGALECASQIYYSEAWGFHAERKFANQALVFTTTLSPIEVLDAALKTEQEVGRDRKAEQREKEITGERYASREVDVDVMFYDDEVINSPRLTLPHPLLHEREFALQPLCEVMADYRHPLFGRTLKSIYDDLTGREKRAQKR